MLNKNNICSCFGFHCFSYLILMCISFLSDNHVICKIGVGLLLVEICVSSGEGSLYIKTREAFV